MSHSDKSLSPPTEPADSQRFAAVLSEVRDPTQVDWERAWFGMEPTFTNQKTLKIWQRSSKSEKAELKYFNHRYVLGMEQKVAQAMERKYGLSCPNVFHAGDGNLHPLILFDDGDPHSVARAEAMGAEILAESVRFGGSITGEHGVGLEKLDSMCLQFGDETLDAFFAIKRAFDPAGLLNPGKAIPTLHRCAELGGMRVQRGALPFADLPRF